MLLKILKWFARILAILSILFMMIFSLDVFDGNETLGRQILGFMIHNIPAFVLIVSLVVAWRFEVAGGVLLILSFVALGILFKSFAGNSASLIILAPLLISGISFIVHGVLYPLNKNKNIT